MRKEPNRSQVGWTELEGFAVLATAIAALLPLAFGFEALIVAPDPPAKVLGALLCLFCGGAIAPVFFVLYSSRHTHFAHLWGNVAGIAGATVALYAQYTVGDHTWWAIAWWALLAASLVGLLVAAKHAELGSHTLWAGVAAVASSATVVGVTQYWWRTFYEPLRVVPVLDVSATLADPQGATKQVVPLDMNITIKNPTSVAIQPLASLFTVSGLRPVRATLGAQSFRGKISSTLSGTPETSAVDRYVAFQRALVAAGPVLSTDEVIPPGESRTAHLIVDFPSRSPRFVDAALRVQIAFVQGERLTPVPLGTPVWCPSVPVPNKVPKNAEKREAFEQTDRRATMCSDFNKAQRHYTSAVVSEWEIPRQTWFAQATTDKRYLLAAVVQARPLIRRENHSYLGSDTPYLFATADARSPNADRSEPGRLGKYYFVSLVTATEVTPVAAAAAVRAGGHSRTGPESKLREDDGLRVR